MDKQAKEAREQMKQLSGKEKWTNFWYYYRVHVIVSVIAVILIAYTAVECANRIDYDMQISYYSSVPVSDDAVNKLTELLKKNVEDINANGSTDVFIASCFADPEQQSEQTQATLMKLSAELAAGDSMAYLADEVYYKRFSSSYSDCFESFTDLSDKKEIKEMFDLKDGQKLYFAVKALYEKEKDNSKKIAAHDNALKAKAYLESLK